MVVDDQELHGRAVRRLPGAWAVILRRGAPVRQGLLQLAMNADESRLFTTNGVSGDITVIDVVSQKAIKSIKVGRFPWGAAVRPAPAADRPERRAAGTAE